MSTSPSFRATLNEFSTGAMSWSAFATAIAKTPHATIAELSFELVEALLRRAPQAAADDFCLRDVTSPSRDSDVAEARLAIGTAAEAVSAREVIVALQGLSRQWVLGSSAQLAVSLELTGGTLQHAQFRECYGIMTSTAATPARPARRATHIIESCMIDMCVEAAARWSTITAEPRDAALFASFARAAMHTFRLAQPSRDEPCPGTVVRAAVTFCSIRGALLAATRSSHRNSSSEAEALAILAVLCTAIDETIEGARLVAEWVLFSGGRASSIPSPLPFVADDGDSAPSADARAPLAPDDAASTTRAAALTVVRLASLAQPRSPRALPNPSQAPAALPAALTEAVAAWVLRDVLIEAVIPALPPHHDSDRRRLPAEMDDPTSSLVSSWCELRRAAAGKLCSPPAISLVASPAARLEMMLPHVAALLAAGARVMGAAKHDFNVSSDAVADALPADDAEERGHRASCLLFAHRAVTALHTAAMSTIESHANGGALLHFPQQLQGRPLLHSARHAALSILHLLSFDDVSAHRLAAHRALRLLLAACASASRWHLLVALLDAVDEAPVAVTALLLDIFRGEVAAALNPSGQQHMHSERGVSVPPTTTIAAPHVEPKSPFADPELVYGVLSDAIGGRLRTGLTRPAGMVQASPGALDNHVEEARAAAGYLESVGDVDLALLSLARLILAAQRARAVGCSDGAKWTPFTPERVRYFRDGLVRPLAAHVALHARALREEAGIMALVPHASATRRMPRDDASSEKDNLLLLGKKDWHMAQRSRPARGTDQALLSHLFLLDAALTPIAELCDAIV